MPKPRKVEIKHERDVHTYAEMWHTSWVFLEMQKEVSGGNYHLWMGSLVFTAFSLEAYFNHIGPKLFNSWSDLETLSPRSKLNVIAEKLGLNIDYGRHPWQTVVDLFGFRNDIAHGKTKKITFETIETLSKHLKNPFRYRAETDWEKYCTQKNAEKARTDVRKIVELIHEAAKVPEEQPFHFGLEIGGSSIIPD